MKNFEYKVGDRVIASDNLGLFKRQPGTIVALWYHSDHPTPYGVKFDGEEFELWSAVHSLIAPEPKIVITTDGTTTLARLYEDGKVTKSAKAKCCPEDTFDFKVGAEIAFNRLIGKPCTEGKHKYKPGDKVKVVKNTCYHLSKIGDVITLTYLFNDGEWHYEENGGFISEDDIEPYVEPPKPKYYNGKVVCVDCGRFDEDSFTVGKVYEIVDGKFTDNLGYTRPSTSDRVKSIEDLTTGYFKDWEYHFIPFVED